MSLRFVALGTILGGCSFQVKVPISDDASVDAADAGVDAPIDTTPDAMIDARDCPAPPAGCTSFTCPSTSSCYFVCSGALRWDVARTRCETANGCLATIDDALEDTCIAAATSPGFPDIVWFGFRQSGNVEPAGGWGWTCGVSSYRAPNWGDFEPNDDGSGEDCGALITGGAWIDGGCDTQARYVCEL